MTPISAGITEMVIGITEKTAGMTKKTGITINTMIFRSINNNLLYLFGG